MPKLCALIDELQSSDHREPVDPKAIYRTRRVGLFEEAAIALVGLLEEIEDMTDEIMALRLSNASMRRERVT